MPGRRILSLQRADHSRLDRHWSGQDFGNRRGRFRPSAISFWLWKNVLESDRFAHFNGIWQTKCWHKACQWTPVIACGSCTVCTGHVNMFGGCLPCAGVLPEEPNAMFPPCHARNVEASHWQSIESECEDWWIWYSIGLGCLRRTASVLHCERSQLESCLPENAATAAKSLRATNDYTVKRGLFWVYGLLRCQSKVQKRLAGRLGWLQ